MDIESKKENFQEDWWTDWIESETLREGVEYVFESGGKRLRPILCIETTRGLGGDLEEAKIVGKALESFHNYTLVHDDIQDGDEYRRDQEAVWKRFGEPVAIEVGDGLHALSYAQILRRSNTLGDEKTLELLELLNRIDRKVAQGQCMDISFRDREVSESEYMRMSRMKTGALIAGSLEAAAIISGREEELRESLRNIGEKMGVAFQIKDDIIDLRGNKGRKERGKDIGEGKKSLIAIKALERLEDEEKKELQEILSKPKEETSAGDVSRAIELYRKADSMEYADGRAEELVESSLESMEELEAEHGLEAPHEIFRFLVDRKF